MSVRVLVAAVLAVAVVATAAGFSASSTATAAQTRPNVLVLMTDDQSLESMRVMANVRGLLAASGTTFANSFVVLLALLPVAGDVPDRPVRAQPRRAGEPAAERRLQHARQHEHAARLAAARRLPHRARRQVPERLRTAAGPRSRPAGASGTASVDPTTYRLLRLHAQRERPARHLRDTARRTTRPTSTRRRPSTSSVAARRRTSPFFLSVAFLAPHSGAPRDARTTRRRRRRSPRRGTGTRSPHEPLPTAAVASTRRTSPTSPPAFATGGCLDRAAARQHPGELPAAARVAARGRRGGRSGSSTRSRRRRARQHADRVHLRQRLLPRRAPDPEREGARLRAVHPRPARDARARRPARAQRPRRGRQHRPGADDPRRRERAPRADARRAVAPGARQASRNPMGPRHPDRGRARSSGTQPVVRGHPHAAVPLQRVREWRSRALRPRPRPARAREQALGLFLLDHPGGARATAGAAAPLHRRDLSAGAAGHAPGVMRAEDHARVGRRGRHPLGDARAVHGPEEADHGPPPAVRNARRPANRCPGHDHAVGRARGHRPAQLLTTSRQRRSGPRRARSRSPTDSSYAPCAPASPACRVPRATRTPPVASRTIENAAATPTPASAQLNSVVDGAITG